MDGMFFSMEFTWWCGDFDGFDVLYIARPERFLSLLSLWEGVGRWDAPSARVR